MIYSHSYLLILESDDNRGRSLADLFRRVGYEVTEETRSGRGVLQAMRQEPRAIFMAEEMPPLEDIGLLPLLQRMTSVPMIVLGAGRQASAANALLNGADMYVSRPFNDAELLARTRALLRRTESTQDSELWLSYP